MTAAADGAPADPRPVLAIIVHQMTPYRVHFHRRIAREIPEYSLRTLLVADSGSCPWEDLDDPEVNIVRLADGRPPRSFTPAGLAMQWRVSCAVARYLDAHRIGAVLSVGYFDLALVRPAFWSRRRRVPCLLFGDGNIRSDRARGVRRALKRLMLPLLIRRFDAVLPCGRLGRDFYAHYGVRQERIILAPYEPDYEYLADAPADDTAALRERLGLQEGRRRILVCGRLVTAKRPDLSLQAFLSVAEQRPEWDIVFAGAGPLRQELEALVPPPLKHRVIFAGFVGRQDQLRALYHSADVLLHAAQHEPWGLIINEAVAAGLAVIATDVTGAAVELVQDGVNGRLVGSRDVAALAAALAEGTDPARLKLFQANAAMVLERWRRAADPIQGLRKALGLPERAGQLASCSTGSR